MAYIVFSRSQIYKVVFTISASFRLWDDMMCLNRAVTTFLEWILNSVGYYLEVLVWIVHSIGSDISLFSSSSPFFSDTSSL